MHPVQDYFLAIAQEYQQILQQVAPCWSEQAKLEQACLAYRQTAIAELKNIERPTHSIDKTERNVGLNSVGLLLDRLSILSIKAWCQRHLNNRNLDNDSLQTEQHYQDLILDITGALSETLPAKHSLNSKITTHKILIAADEWESTIYDLMVTNLLIWKAQEVIYCKSSREVAQQFQMYIALFPEINLRRDALICRCESLYWSTVQA